jgi:acyl-CoA hydrolase
VSGEAVITRLVFADQTNHHGTLFGGEALGMLASAASIAATRRARHPVVLASSASTDFVAPVPLGAIAEARATVESVGRTSLTLDATLEAEDLLTGTRTRACAGRLVFVAVDAAGDPTPVTGYADEPLRGARSKPLFTETSQFVRPGAANSAGVLFGGELMRLLDATGFIAASRQVRAPLVTARLERTEFHTAAAVGELVRLRASIADVGARSVRVDVEATAENVLSGSERPCTTGRFVFVRPRPASDSRGGG